MTTGHRLLKHELSKKAEQILGHAPTVFDPNQQAHFDLSHHTQPSRLVISSTSATVSSRSSVPTSSTTVHSHQPSLPSGATTDVSNGKNRRLVTVEQLVPYIMQLVSVPAFGKLPETISRHRSRSKHADNVMDSRAKTLALHRTTSVQLSDDENEDEEEEKENSDHQHTATVLTEINENNTNSINQKNSNGNQLFENQIESQHSGIISSLYQQDDSEDDDSDDQAATHSDTENDEGTKQTNPNTLSLMDFVVDKRPPPPPSTKTVSPTPPSIVTESSIGAKKRSVSPTPIESSHDDDVHNQSKRKKFAGNRALLKAFSSSVHTKIDRKRPSLSIIIPTQLFFDLPPSEDDPTVAMRPVRTSKRYINDSVKHDTTGDNANNDGMAPPPPPLLNNQIYSTTNTNGIHQKKNKTSHVHEKIVYKQEQQQSSSSTNVSLVTVKNEQNVVSSTFDQSSSIDNKVNLPMTTTTTTTQPKKEKPTANVKPLQQSTPIDSSSSTNIIPNDGIRTKVPSGTSNPAHARTVLPSTKMNYAKLKNMSIKELDSLARQKKKQADGGGKRANFDEARQSMALYLESVCYFILCAHDEPVHDRRANLLTTTLTMLQELMRNHQKMFNPTQSNQVDILCNVRPKFLLIIYWLQSLIYHLQFNGNMPQIERCANQVSDYFNQLKNPSSAAALTTATRITSTTTTTTVTQQAQLTPVTDSNPISPLSTASQASSSDQSTTSVNGIEHHRVLLEFSKMMLNSYHSTYFWNKAERLLRDKPLKDFTEQLQKQNQNRRLTRDETTLDFVLYIFDAIELLRLSPA
jgi:hypothetical protein